MRLGGSFQLSSLPLPWCDWSRPQWGGCAPGHASAGLPSQAVKRSGSSDDPLTETGWASLGFPVVAMAGGAGGSVVHSADAAPAKSNEARTNPCPLDEPDQGPHPHRESESIFVSVTQLPPDFLHAHSWISPVTGPDRQAVAVLVRFTQVAP